MPAEKASSLVGAVSTSPGVAACCCALQIHVDACKEAETVAKRIHSSGSVDPTKREKMLNHNWDIRQAGPHCPLGQPNT
ncbi:heavy metal sensor signal transduction histidine kinase [Anopheles sinensis]|uniref:Heavy metal sensor signal transduction histidine kinase n=1 Tax=Anopheles sinensis TaxID=74873 RepID=A0A084WDJ6_ANOSI|nr:heavy metal sensor signal transduction histidine kinase [Anopheles sinensis]